VNSTGQQIYDPKANDGKGDYTEHATRNERVMGDALRQTDAGKAQFDKLVDSNQKTVVIINNSQEVVVRYLHNSHCLQVPNKLVSMRPCTEEGNFDC
jgi:hypothetical protein